MMISRQEDLHRSYSLPNFVKVSVSSRIMTFAFTGFGDENLDLDLFYYFL